MPSGSEVVLRSHAEDENMLAAAYMPFICNGGFFVHTHKEDLMGSKIKLQLRLLDCDREYDIDGVVIWQTPSSAQDTIKQGVGIQFLGNTLALRTHIEDLLAANKPSLGETYTL